MFKSDTLRLVDQFVELDGSTTSFLESLKGMKLNMTIESQVEILKFEGSIIRRAVKLYFERSDAPVFYCISNLNRKNLKFEEYKMLIEEAIPIGKIFPCFNIATEIKKKNLSFTQEIDESLAMALNVKSPLLFRKMYDYWVGDREIGCIQEFFNEESLQRI